MKKLILILFLFPFVLLGQGTKTINGDLIVTDTITTQALDNAINGNKPIVVDADGKFILSPNTVLVIDTGDFPTSIAGVHTLAENTIYILAGPITTPNRFVLPKVGCLAATSGLTGTITYTGSGTLFTATQMDGFTITDIICINTGGGTAFNITGVPLVFQSNFIIDNTGWSGFTNLGSFANSTVRISNTTFAFFDIGLNITSSLGYTQNFCFWLNAVAASTPFLSFSGVHNLINVKDNNFNALAGEEMFFVDPGITLNAGVISGNLYKNGTSTWFGAGSLTENDIRFEYSANGDAPETSEDAFMNISSSVAETVVAGVFEKVAGTYTAATLNRFTHSNGTLTYIGRQTKTFTIIAPVSVTTLNNNRTIDFRAAKNGVSISDSNQRRFLSTGADVGGRTVVAQVQLSTGDTVEIHYTTVTSGTDITAPFLTFAIQ